MNHSPLICISGGIEQRKVRRMPHSEASRSSKSSTATAKLTLYNGLQPIHTLLRIAEEIDPKAVCDDVIDRRILAKTVFGNPELLQRLNSIVHTAVTDELCRRHKEFSKNKSGNTFFFAKRLYCTKAG